MRAVAADSSPVDMVCRSDPSSSMSRSR
jgi:hypothetical protein